jgi:hypothetical protein
MAGQACLFLAADAAFQEPRALPMHFSAGKLHMRASGCRQTCSLMVLALLAMGGPSFAQTYHQRHYGDQARQARAEADEKDREQPGKPVGFVAAIDRTIHACGQQALELRQLPLDAISRSAQLRDVQRAALERVQRSAMAAAKALDARCPRSAPAELTARIDVLDGALGSVVDSLNRIRPALATFYDLLDDEQKARLVVMSFSGKPASKADPGARKGGGVHGDGAADAAPGPICAQWAANLRTWPIQQIDSSRMQLSDQQRAALYELTAAIYRSAGDLTEACPTDSQVTPLARLEAKEHELQAVRQDIEAIRPFAAAFEAALNDTQRKQLAQQVEVSGGGRRTR